MTDLFRALLAALCSAGLAAASSAAEIPMDRWHVEASSRPDAVAEALSHFQGRVLGLGGAEPRSIAPGEEATRLVVEVGDGPELAGLEGFRREQGYLVTESGPRTILVRAATPLGAAFGISDLETRLRADGGGVRLAFPEWDGERPRRLLEAPAIATRGEYLNIGYDLPGITPHQWGDAQWRRYIDGLVLSRLNRLYLYFWVDTYTMFPGSGLSKRPGNLSLHERAREAIRYARRRGLAVTLMISPTVIPRDIWLAHPEWKADISYADHGFACVCPNAPGSWDLMKQVWRTEMEWFRDADSVQVWFYDPGGCWCEKYGCKPDQAETLAREVREFGSMFRELHPGAGVEYNFWPAWLWEAEKKTEVRRPLAAKVREVFAGDPAPVTVMGTSEGGGEAMPRLEREMGLQGGVFLFAANPESSYVFPTPHLRYLQQMARRARDAGMEAAFGHRLEASTRDVGTFLMGQWLWEPDLSAEKAVRRFSEWKTAGEAPGRRLAEAVVVLDELTVDGIRPELGRKLESLLADLPSGLPAACREDLEFWPAVGSALRTIGESQGAEGDALKAYAEEFARSMAKARAFAPLASQAGELFRRYRGFLEKGWKKDVF